MQPVGELAQVEKLHLEAGNKGASHKGGMEKKMSLLSSLSPGGKGKGQACVRSRARSKGWKE